MAKIRIAIVGVGNCASSLVQGVAYYRRANDNSVGLMHWDLGGYDPTDIEVAAAFDIDERKVGADVAEAIFAKPNCTAVFAEVPRSGVTVRMGAVLDGMADHMEAMPADRSFRLAKSAQPDREEIVAALKQAEVDVLVNFLPVGSEDAVRFYMECALEAGVGVVNCMPVFIASDPEWEARFKEKGLPIVGDDIKAQFGATIVHRTLSNLMRQRGVRLERTYQLNTGGNTDFLNMMDRGRLASKKVSKTEAVQAVLAERLADEKTSMSGPRRLQCPGSKRQQALFSAARRGPVRQRADEHRGAAIGGGLAQLGRRRHRRHPLLQAGAQARRGRRADRSVGLFLQASAPAIHRRRGAADDRNLHPAPGQDRREDQVPYRRRWPRNPFPRRGALQARRLSRACL